MSNNFADNLKKIRKDNNLSQEQLADRLGVSRQAISKWESAAAYPEMDKIIFLCDKFNLNIDDLLHGDIEKIKNEEKSKKDINKYIDSFLKFITDTINLFSNMSFKSKIKFIFEEIVIATILLLVLLIGYSFLDYIFSSIFSFMPYNNYINDIIDSIIILFFVVSSIVIFIHIFKIRYLDYYYKFQKQVDENIENKDDIKDNNLKNKISFKENDNKIIIRDPKHSEYGFINILYKSIIMIIKLFTLCFAVFLAIFLVGIFAGFIISFILYKTGALFIGLLGTCLSLGIIDIIFILIIFNFVFDRKNDKRKIIWGLIGSLIVFGVSCGLIFIGTLNFDIINNEKVDSIEIEMKDNLFFSDIYHKEYIESDINNIKIEYTINDLFDAEFYKEHESGVYIWSYCSNPIKMAREVISNMNNKKILNINSDITNVKIYASKENIEKIKQNEKIYYEEERDYESEISEYQNTIDDYQEKIDNYEIEISNLKTEIETYKSEIEKYQYNN